VHTELDETVWQGRRRAHEARVDTWVRPHLARRSHGDAHPVDDFLFTYYSYSPGALRRWHPGSGIALTGSGIEHYRRVTGYVVEGGRAYVGPATVSQRLDRVQWIGDLLAATASRPAMVGCFGLHEWAMVYRQSVAAVRHRAYPLRLGPQGTDTVVESHRITCTHHDAFRFFTEPARPLNAIQPTRPAQQAQEQPGCLHATMDLYKWAYQLAPLTSSELVADCFELAYEVRQVDMRAAPYDLADLGLAPIRIESPAGRREYVDAQRSFAGRAEPLRGRLIAECERLLAG
jgi:hypothetical protein